MDTCHNREKSQNNNQAQSSKEHTTSFPRFEMKVNSLMEKETSSAARGIEGNEQEDCKRASIYQTSFPDSS